MVTGLKAGRFVFAIVLTLFFSIAIYSLGLAHVQAKEDSSQQNGLKGDFYISSEPGAFDFSEKKATIVSPNINFGNLNPTLKTLTGQEDDVTVRWTGQIKPEYTEDYTFSMIGDNGFRLWIDNQLVIDHWVNDWDIEQVSEPISLEAGKTYDIKIEYFEDHGGAHLKLNWSSASQEKEIVPNNRLYLPEGFTNEGPISSSVSESGKTIEMNFQSELNEVPENANDHFTTIGNSKPTSISLKEDDPSTLILELDYPITSKDDENLLVTYDGEGQLTKKDGDVLPSFSTMVKNNSTFIISSKWADEVTADNVLPEYPRPQMVREDWMNLNGEWEFQEASEGDDLPAGKTLDEKILVPFAVESRLSGVERHEDHVWYKRNFTIPEGWTGDDILLHFGAVDWKTVVYVNGEEVGSHKGGYDSFDFNITDFLKEGNNELIVEVYDSTSTSRALGKQRLNPGGIFYTSVTGIWQTVWLEPVSNAHIENLKMTPEINEEYLELVVEGSELNGETIETIAYKDGEEVGRATGAVGEEIQIPVPDPRLWSTTDPFLYDLKVKLKDGQNTIDEVSSYFGMREISLGKVDGTLRPLLNGEFVFQMGPLDQGYWPAGLYTAPTDEALKFDIEAAKELGFNMIRKHAKVEPQRFHYWADKLGMLVWQDMPSMFDNNPSDEDAEQFEHEFDEIIKEHYNSPSLIVWTVFNEGWGQYDTERITEWVEDTDPTRLVNNASGWTDKGVGDMIDFHCYVGPCSPTPTDDRIAVLGEYGGLGLHVPGHEWNSNVFNYEMQDSKEQLTNRYLGLIEQIKQYKENSGLSAAVYTQITDVEIEINGLLSYDRKVEKVDFDKLRKAHKELIGQVNVSDLLELINQTQSLLDNAEAGEEPGQYPQDSIDALAAAITKAQDVANKDDATQSEIKNAIHALKDAVSLFKDQINPPIPEGAEVDHFNNGTLAEEWMIYNETEEKKWSLTDVAGKLRLHTSQGDSYQEQNQLKNVFLRGAPSEDFEITTKVTAPINQNHQQAGLFVWEDEDNYVRFGHVWDTIANTGYSLETAKEEGGQYSKAENMVSHPGNDTMYLKIKKEGNLFTTYYWDGSEWVQAADSITASLDDIKIGFYATSTFADDIYADFDYFTIKSPEDVSIESIQTLINEYENGGEIEQPLAKKLSNKLDQAEHQLDKGHINQAIKKMNGFLKHLNNKAMDKFITDNAKENLNKVANKLIDSWK
ncbi:FIMAH domain-containing protein [Virgibacillus phasianinus]|uniref:FIMAH domain-containing protein n=1 Tax=Virgibacillus phasianinus TaxID=2017483 RepID=UPI001C12CAFC|nr:PA14 domain-containing protein [Virgibacillus phasianinus]